MSNVALNKNIDTLISTLNDKADRELGNSDKASQINNLADSAYKLAQAADLLINDTITLNNEKFSIMQNKIDNIKPSIPIGLIIPYTGSTIPEGFLICNGGSISRTTYSDLFNVIGTTFGSNDESSFNLPQLTDNRFIEGSNTVGEYKEAGLPQLEGVANQIAHVGNNASGVLTFESGSLCEIRGSYSGHYVANLTFSSKNYNSIYGNSETNQPKSLKVIYIIKY